MRNKTTVIDKKRRLRKFRNSSESKEFISVNQGHKGMGVALVASYPPRECGIATFSVDLEKSMTDRYGSSIAFKIFALQNSNELYSYDVDRIEPFNTDHKINFIRTAMVINQDDSIQLVMIQHEFGLFKKNENAFLEFLEMLDKPVVLTFHTVLPRPDRNLLLNVKSIAQRCSRLVVMTQTSADILISDYKIDVQKISIVSHGTHLVPTVERETLKAKYGLSNKNVLSTFGLLGPGKSIETTLKALPSIIKEFPDTIFLILGKTHPGLVAESGEKYRDFLQDIVNELDISKNVTFVNKFLPLDELLEYLQLSDIYVFSSKDPNQAVSGTFAYALSCGCPVISTPIPHAKEVLRNGSGRIMDFEDSETLASIAIELLTDDQERERMRRNGLAHTLSTSWENVAITIGDILNDLIVDSNTLKFKVPDIDLKHVGKMTDDIGMFQFSINDVPDLASGYTLDDNARALIALCEYFELSSDKSALSAIRKYATFIQRCQRFQSGFYNYVDENLSFTQQNQEVNLEDSNGRAIWALGRLLSIEPILPETMHGLLFSCRQLFSETHHLSLDVHSPRAMAFTIKGIYFASKDHPNDLAKALAIELGERLINMYKHHRSENWKWFESHLTYGNAVLPEAIAMTFALTGIIEYKNIAKESMDFLISKTMDQNGIHVVPNTNWKREGQIEPQCFEGGEQPIDISYMIIALETFHKQFPDQGYSRSLVRAFSWFLGDNSLRQTMYNPCTGGCHDGLELNNVNLNQGAESTISYLLARLAIERIQQNG